MEAWVRRRRSSCDGLMTAQVFADAGISFRRLRTARRGGHAVNFGDFVQKPIGGVAQVLCSGSRPHRTLRLAPSSRGGLARPRPASRRPASARLASRWRCSRPRPHRSGPWPCPARPATWTAGLSASGCTRRTRALLRELLLSQVRDAARDLGVGGGRLADVGVGLGCINVEDLLLGQVFPVFFGNGRSSFRV